MRLLNDLAFIQIEKCKRGIKQATQLSIVKNKISDMKSGLEYLGRQETFVIVGVAMALGTLGKLLNFYDISSDWFWFIGGLGLIIEGSISLMRQRKFDKKYKIIEVDSPEYQKLLALQKS